MRLRRPDSAHLGALRGLRAPSMWLFRCPAGPPEASRAGTITGSDSHPCEGAAEPWPAGRPRSCAVRAGLGAGKARGRQVAPPGPRSGPPGLGAVAACASRLQNGGLRSAAWARGAGAQWRGAGPSLSRFVRAPSLVHRFGRQHAVPARRSRVEELGHAEGLDPESERDAAAAGPPVPSFKRGECVLSVGRNKASEPRFAYTQCSHYQRSLVRLPRPRLENDF